jgi:signal peptide peptidase SppA
MKLPFTKSPPVVPVIKLHGVIDAGARLSRGLSIADLSEPIDQAFKTKNARAVALSINSPGGSPVQSTLIFKRIRQLADEKGLPVYAFTEDVAASGGYLIALAADEIFADESSIVGSIGVISAGFGFQDLIARIGVERRVHTVGDSKSVLDPFQPEDPKDVELLAGVQGDVYETFTGLVKERRRGRLKGDEATLFSGAFWSGRQAVERGLVDGIGDIRGTLRKRFGPDVKLHVMGKKGGLLKRLRGDDGDAGVRGGPPGSLAKAAAHWPEELLTSLEIRALWNRYGL